MIQELLIIFVALLIGGALKGATGMGTPIVAVPALAAFFDVPFAIAVLVVPDLLTNAWQAWRIPRPLGGPRLPAAPSVVSAVVGIVDRHLVADDAAGQSAVARPGDDDTPLHRRPAGRPELTIGPAPPAAGPRPSASASGVLQGATGVSAPVSVTFINGMRLSRPQFVLTVSMFFLAFVLTQIPTLSLAGVLTWQRLLYSVIALVPVRHRHAASAAGSAARLSAKSLRPPDPDPPGSHRPEAFLGCWTFQALPVGTQPARISSLRGIDATGHLPCGLHTAPWLLKLPGA